MIWATGFTPNWSWVKLPIFDERGYPEHERGITTMEGVSVLGLPWLHTWGSGRFAGIAEDAEHVVEHIAARASRDARATAASSPPAHDRRRPTPPAPPPEPVLPRRERAERRRSPTGAVPRRRG